MRVWDPRDGRGSTSKVETRDVWAVRLENVVVKYITNFTYECMEHLDRVLLYGNPCRYSLALVQTIHVFNKAGRQACCSIKATSITNASPAR